MQVSNIEITVSNEITVESATAQTEVSTATIRFSELQCIGGGQGAVAW